MRRKLLALTIIALLVAVASTYFYFAAKAQGYAAIRSENFIGTVQTALYLNVTDKYGNVRTIVLTPSYRQYAVWTPVGEAQEGTQITGITVTLDILTWGVALKDVDPTSATRYYDVNAQVNMTLRKWTSYSTAEEAMRAFYSEIERGKTEEEAYTYVTAMMGQWGSWTENYDTKTSSYSSDSLRYRATKTFSFTIPSLTSGEEDTVWAMEFLFGWKVNVNGTAIAGNPVEASTSDMYLAKPENEAYIIKLRIIRTEWGWISVSVSVGIATSAWVPPQLYNIAPVLIDTVTKLLALLQMALTTVILVERVRK